MRVIKKLLKMKRSNQNDMADALAFLDNGSMKNNSRKPDVLGKGFSPAVAALAEYVGPLEMAHRESPIDKETMHPTFLTDDCKAQYIKDCEEDLRTMDMFIAKGGTISGFQPAIDEGEDDD